MNYLNKYPKTEKYDKAWIEKNWMGPNPLWLLEDLCEHLDLQPGMKVLDLGCGKGITSVFLAKEYGVTVFANDLWISATDNLRRFEEAGVSDKVYPINAEAHVLPYAEGFFDAVIAIDSYHYFGTSDSYFVDIFSKLVRQGGQLGIVVPGLRNEFEKGYPDTLKDLWFPELYTFHNSVWWQKLWEKTGLCDIISCYNINDSKAIWQHWADWSLENFAREFGVGDDGDDGSLDAKLLETDTSNELTMIALAARKK